MALTFPVETPTQRANAMSTRLAVLDKEKAAQQANGTVDPALDREIARTQTQTSAPSGGFNAEAITNFAKSAVNAQPTNTGSQQQPASQATDSGFNAKNILDWTKGAVEAPTTQPSSSQSSSPSLLDQAKEVGGMTVSDAGKQLGQGTASTLDAAWNIVPNVVGGVVYAGARALGQSPEQATSEASNSTNWMTNPFGKAFGVTDTPGYNPKALDDAKAFISQNWDKGASWISQHVGLPKADVSNMMQTLTYAIPALAKRLAPAIKNAGKTLSSAAEETAAGEVPSGPKPNAVASARATYTAPEGMQPRPMIGTGASAVTSNPYPKFTGEENVRGPFPQIKLAKNAGDVSLEEQRFRAGVANDILGPENQSVRLGVVTGNENKLRNEYTAASAPNPTPAETVLKAQIAREQQALSNYAQQRVEASGASPSLVNDAQRGEAINNAIYGPEDSLVSYLRNAKQQIYDQARTQVGDNPIQTSHVENLLNDPQFKAGVKLSKNEGVLNGAEELINLAKNSGFKNPVTGEVVPAGSVAAWDAVRKALNYGWTKDNASVIRQINTAIDQDVASAGGPGLYKMGDAIHKAEKTILGSKGISKVFGEVDPNGVATGTPFEKVPQALNNMPMDQWRHIYDTFDMLSRGQIRGVPEGMPEVPKPVMEAAAAAKAEIRGALARDVYEAGANKIGAWNQNAANKVLNSVVGQKILEAMPPDEVYKFHTLNYGGQMMPGVHSYEGAGLQAQRLAQEGWLERHAPGIGAAAGSKAGPIGAVIGQKTGSFVGNMSRAQRQTSQMNSLVEIMRKAAEDAEKPQ